MILHVALNVTNTSMFRWKIFKFLDLHVNAFEGYVLFIMLITTPHVYAIKTDMHLHKSFYKIFHLWF